MMRYVAISLVVMVILMVVRIQFLKRLEKESKSILNESNIANIKEYSDTDKRKVAKWKISDVVSKASYIPLAFISVGVFYSHFDIRVIILAMIYVGANIGLWMIARKNYKEDYKSFFNTEYNIKRLGSEGVRLIIEKIDRNKHVRSTEPREVNVEETSIAENYKKLFNLVTTTILTLLFGFVILIVVMMII